MIKTIKLVHLSHIKHMIRNFTASLIRLICLFYANILLYYMPHIEFIIKKTQTYLLIK